MSDSFLNTIEDCRRSCRRTESDKCLLKRIVKLFESIDGKVPYHLIESCSIVFGEDFQKALVLIEKKAVSYYHAENNQRLGYYEVASGGDLYTVSVTSNSCSCPKVDCTKNGGLVACEHVLAALLSKYFPGSMLSIPISRDQLIQQRKYAGDCDSEEENMDVDYIY